MPFRTRPGQPRDLRALIDEEVRERIEDAVDHVSLEILVESRRARGAPPPAADSTRDREEFSTGVRAFLERLLDELLREASAEVQGKAGEASARSRDAIGRLVTAQVALARELPDYWQRFDAIRAAYTSEQRASRGQGGGRVGRLFGR